MEKRRLKVLVLSSKDIIAALSIQDGGECATFTNLPKDAHVIAVSGNFRSGTIEMLLEHPDFEEIASGIEAPLFKGEIKYFRSIAEVLSTEQLVKELSAREGVDREDVPVEAEGGPSVLLRITD